MDFPGLIELLAKNLYPKEDMFVRELVQNAHDSILKRQSFEPAPAGRIDITANRDAKTIAFQDNGAGMTEEEIITYLATIGRSGTRELREKLKERDRDTALSLIGQFGIGVLSAFVAAKRLIVDTRSSLPDSQLGLRWTVSGGPDYALEPVKREQPGTTVTLHLKDEYLGMTSPETLKTAVRKYADFLPFPISVNGQGPINTMQAPWHRHYASDAERRNAYRAWLNDRFPDFPLEIIPVDIEAPYPVKGVLYISDRHIPDVNMAGMVDIYQARMFICEADRNILPLWAKFVRGVIDSPALTPTAARDAVQENRVHDNIRTTLGHLIVDSLQKLAKEDPPRFRQLMEWHHFHIKGMAVQYDDFFDAIADTVIFEVNLREPDGRSFRKLTLPEYREKQEETDEAGRKAIYYISEGGAAPQFYRLCEAKGILAINTGLVFEEEFLKKYAARHANDVTLRRVDMAGGTTIFEPLSESERVEYVDLEFRITVLLRGALPDQQITVQTEHFAPHEIPAVLTQTKDVEIAQELEKLRDHLAMTGALRNAVTEALGIQKRRLQPVVLHINAGSELIQRLRQEDFSNPLITDVWLTLYNNSFMYSRHYLSAQNLEVLHAQTLRALHNVLEQREELRRLAARIALLEKQQPKHAARRTEHSSLFVMMTYGQEYKVLEQALRTVFEDDPYWFQIILARQRTLHDNLFENVKAHMRLVHGFVADISDLNANVMLELGMTEADTEERPVIVLRHNRGQNAPADLVGRLYVEYELPTGEEAFQQLAASLRQHFGTIDALETLRHNRVVHYLSVTYVRRVAPLLPIQEAATLCKCFLTVEALKETKEPNIVQKTGLDAAVVAYVKKAFTKARV